MTIDMKNLLAGLVFISLGLFFALQAIVNLRMGTAASMGPGYFPTALGGILVALGVGIALSGLNRPRNPLGTVPWRGLSLVVASILFFALTVHGLGFAPALVGTGFLAAMSSGKLSWLPALVVAVAIAAFGSLVFVYGIKLPYPLIGRWILG